MEPYHVKTDDVELGVHIGEDGVIYVRLSGNITADNEVLLREWDSKVREAMKTQGESMPGHVLCYTDVTGGLEVDKTALDIATQQFKYNKQFITRTGVVGTHFFMRAIMKIALKAAGRTNMKAFNTKEDAMRWLHEADATGELH